LFVPLSLSEKLREKFSLYDTLRNLYRTTPQGWRDYEDGEDPIRNSMTFSQQFIINLSNTSQFMPKITSHFYKALNHTTTICLVLAHMYYV